MLWATWIICVRLAIATQKENSKKTPEEIQEENSKKIGEIIFNEMQKLPGKGPKGEKKDVQLSDKEFPFVNERALKDVRISFTMPSKFDQSWTYGIRADVGQITIAPATLTAKFTYAPAVGGSESLEVPLEEVYVSVKCTKYTDAEEVKIVGSWSSLMSARLVPGKRRDDKTNQPLSWFRKVADATAGEQNDDKFKDLITKVGYAFAGKIFEPLDGREDLRKTTGPCGKLSVKRGRN